MDMAVFNQKAAGMAGCIYLVMAFTPSFAQQNHPFTLSDYVDSARRHLPLLLEKKALVNAALAGIQDARHSFLPNAYLMDQVNLGTDNSLPGSYLSYGVIPSTSSGVRGTNVYQSASGNIAILAGEYELLDFGLKQARVRDASAFAGLTQADLDKERYLLNWQVGKLYFDILKSLYQLSIDSENVRRYEALYRVIRAVTLSGIRAGADSALALAELSKTRVSYNQTLGQILQSQQQLSYLTGIPPEKIAVDTSGARTYLSPTNLPAAGPPSDSLVNPLTDYFAREKFLRLAEEDLVKKSYLPKLMLTGTTWGRGSSIDYNGNYHSLGSGLGFQRWNYLAGLTLVYDLFNGVHRRDKLEISRNQALASDFELQQQILSLKNIGSQADQALLTAEKNLLEIPVQVRAAQDAFNQKTAQYRAGIINLVDLTNASFVLYRSQTDYVQTLSDWLLASLDKAAATGNLDPFIHSIKN
jgi:outer membrane protein TolC